MTIALWIAGYVVVGFATGVVVYLFEDDPGMASAAAVFWPVAWFIGIIFGLFAGLTVAIEWVGDALERRP